MYVCMYVRTYVCMWLMLLHLDIYYEGISALYNG